MPLAQKPPRGTPAPPGEWSVGKELFSKGAGAFSTGDLDIFSEDPTHDDLTGGPGDFAGNLVFGSDLEGGAGAFAVDPVRVCLQSCPRSMHV